MKAIVRTGLEAGQMSLQDIPKPVPAADQALIRVRAVGICGTDAHMYSGHQETEIPVVIGHEFSGEVVEVGDRVANVKPGDRVVSRLNIGVCGVCRACLTGNPHMCEHRTCPGYKLDGAYAEYIAIEARMLVKLDDGVSYEEAAVVEPMAIVAHALLQRTGVEAEDVVVLFGPGPIGLIATQMVKLAGAAKLIVVGTDVDEKQRLPLAKKLGADLVLNSQRTNVEEEVLKFTGGRKPDLVVEASGAVPAINTGLRLLRRQGRMCVLGLVSKRESSVEWLTASEKSLSITFSYSSSPWSWNMVTSMLGRKAIDAKSLISHTAPLEDFEAMFAEIAKGNAIKCILKP